MPAAPMPAHETERLMALTSYASLRDTAARELFGRYAKLAGYVLRTPHAAVSLVERDQQQLYGLPGTPTCSTNRDVALCSYTILHDKPLIVEDASRDPRFSDNPLVTDSPGIRFYAGAPLTSPEGFNIGSLCGFDTRPRTITNEQRDVLCELAAGLMTTLNLMRSSSRMKDLALTDALTGLPNRVCFLKALDETVQQFNTRNAPFSLVYLDCDHFKRLNDTAGHEAGDNLLCVLASELQEQIRSTDLAARLGGDEFAVLLRGTDAAEAQATAGRFMQRFRRIVTSTAWGTSLSIGVATFRQGSLTAREAMSFADAAMYEAKRVGRDTLAAKTFGPQHLPQGFSYSNGVAMA